jgi:3-phosphoshikimate 1-carboxyvinyltransferase
MKSLCVKSTSIVQGTITLPGDKSIAHRALIISAIAKGATSINNFPANEDCLRTLSALQKLGIRIAKNLKSEKLSEVKVFGRGLGGLKKPQGILFLGDSGTSFRLLCGLLSGQGFRLRLEAGPSLSRRPMRRISVPLRMMGAEITAGRRSQSANRAEEYPPLAVKGGNLKGITYKLPVASAQVKTAIILAGLYARGVTCVIEPVKTRDHTERMLKLFQADIKIIKNKIKIKGKRELLSPARLDIPGDISSGTFFIVMAAIVPGSHLVIKNVGLNPLRIGALMVLKRMGADIKVIKSPTRQANMLEPVGDIIVKSSSLRGAVVEKKEIPSMIDELPILMLAASLACGRTVFEGAGELRVKETDRINSMCKNLAGMGARIEIARRRDSENIIIDGVKELQGAKVKSFGDHRTAMSMVAAGLVAKGKIQIDDLSCIRKSFPAFLDKLTSILYR